MEQQKKLFSHVENGKDTVKIQGEDILYLILIEGDWKYDDNAESFRTWDFKTGRQNAYDYIKDMIVNEGADDVDVIINLDKSKIYAENPHVENSKLKLSNGISLYAFMKDAQVLQKVDCDLAFDIDDYRCEEITDSDNRDDD